jgi:tight adherence protein C
VTAGSLATGAFLGLGGGLGLLLVVRALPVARRPELDDRVGPYLGDAATGARLRAAAGGGGGPAAARAMSARAVPVLDRVLGGRASVARRLARAGRECAVERFRLEQLAWGATGLAIALGLSLLLLAGGSVRQPLALVVLCAVSAVAGVLSRDRALSREVARREARMMAEFPTLAELLALSVAAGEGATGALERVTSVGRGELAAELRTALADARAGATLTEALARLADRTGVPALARFVDGVAVAIERGTPLADVLRAQAADAREAGRRELLEAGGRKEIAMMIPVVFLILPTTVVFALYPGFFALHLYAP